MSKKRILFIKVPSSVYSNKRRFDDYATKHTYSFFPSYALAALSGFLEEHLKIDYELKIIDINMFAVSLGQLAIEKFPGYITEVIKNNSFDILLLSCQYMFNQRWVEDVAKVAHQMNPQVKIIVGGGFATVFPEKAIQSPYVDYAVIGEGESALVHIINRILAFKDEQFESEFPFDGYCEKLPDGNWRVFEKKTFIQNLEKLPSPNWKWMDFEEYKKNYPSPYIPFMASRGCPYNCSYCSTRLYWGRRFRYRALNDVIDEILYSYHQFGIRKFLCFDDTPTFNKGWFLEFCKQYETLPRDIELGFDNFSIKNLDEEILNGLKILKVKRISLAIESGSDEIQRAINKRLGLKEVERKICLIKKMGFQLHVCWMVGFPNETLKQIDETINMARKFRAESIQIYPVFPFPGTKMYKELRAQNLIDLDEDDYESMSYQNAGKILSKEWDAGRLSQIAYDANIEMNFLDNPLYDSDAGRKELKACLDDLTKTLSDHVIAFIVLGFLAGRFYKNQLERERNYGVAFNLLKNGSPTFKTYMGWDFPQINDFKKWITEKKMQNDFIV